METVSYQNVAPLGLGGSFLRDILPKWRPAGAGVRYSRGVLPSGPRRSLLISVLTMCRAYGVTVLATVIGYDHPLPIDQL